ncbi:hypothetical protein [Bacillus thuringiensis]|uniref:hypothetical protein n=1 Tax=Bacillus thuringiensis TaxID=1428 RepID=UPI000BFB1F52|nr:hypothetical protein [Bacillus thuringiensis]PGT90070.1 hypothetical protein COD17_09990 [Bacillus thuringiensis]
MVEDTKVVKSSSGSAFANTLNMEVKKMQAGGLDVEVQYQPVFDQQQNKILHTALLIGKDNSVDRKTKDAIDRFLEEGDNE